MPPARLHQYFGPSPRLPQPCIELSFDHDPRAVSLDAVARAYQGIGRPLSFALASGEFPVPEAVAHLTMSATGIAEFGSCVWGSRNERDWVCLAFPFARASASALANAYRLLIACNFGPEPDAAALHRLAVPNLRTSSASMIHAAAVMGIDAQMVSRIAAVWKLGQGKAGRLYYATSSSGDSFPGAQIANDKRATVEVLSRAGFPTTRALGAPTAELAEQAIRQAGFPCVVKPAFGGKGYGVSTRITSLEMARKAIDKAIRETGLPLVIENHVEGTDHRILIVDGNILWVYQRIQAHVTGDGKSTVAQLIAAENAERATRSNEERTIVQVLTADASREDFLRDRYGIGLQDVPAAGERIELAGQANIAQGGKLREVSHLVHPDNREMFLRIPRLIGMSVVGIDYMTKDITRSWREEPGAIIEINSTPAIGGLRDGCLMLRPSLDRRLDCRVPTFVVTGDRAYRDAVSARIVTQLQERGLYTGTAEYLGGRPPGESQIIDSMRAPEIENLLLDERVEAMVIAADPALIGRHGFPLLACDAAIASAPLAVPAPLAVIAAEDGDRVRSLVDQVCDAHADPAKGGPREWLQRVSPPDAAQVVLRVWRPWAMPRDRFVAGLPPIPDSMHPATTRFDMVAAVAAFANARLAAAGSPPLTGEFTFRDDDDPFGPPFLIATLEAGQSAEAARAIDLAIDEVNRRLTFTQAS